MNSTTRMAFALLATMAATPALADDCDVVKAATIAAAETPHTSVQTATTNGKTVTSSVIQTQTTTYVQIGGAWHASPTSAQDRLKLITDNFKTAKITCTKIGTDTINGEPVTVYANHLENEGVVADSKIWISARGLPLKTENHPEGGAASTSTSDYEHYAPPPGVK
jgi:hypothetical protein